MTKKPLREGPITDRILRSAAGKSDPFGVGARAQGRIDTTTYVKALKQSYWRYLGQTGAKATVENLRQFMASTHNVNIEPELQALKFLPDPNAPQPEQAMTPEQEKIKATLRTLGAKLPPPVRSYQDKEMTAIVRKLRHSDWPDFDKVQVLQMVKQMAQYGAVRGGIEKERIDYFIDLIEKNPRWKKALPELPQVRKMLEHHIASFMNHLVENKVTTRAAFEESYSLFFEAETPLSNKAINTILTRVVQRASQARANLGMAPAAGNRPTTGYPQRLGGAPQQVAQPRQQAMAQQTRTGDFDLDLINTNMHELGGRREHLEDVWRRLRRADPQDAYRLLKDMNGDEAKIALAAVLAAMKDR